MTPDNKSKFEHFQARNNQYSVGTRTVDSDKRFDECNRNSCINPKNCAGVKYLERDIEFFCNNVDHGHQHKTIAKLSHRFKSSSA